MDISLSFSGEESSERPQTHNRSPSHHANSSGIIESKLASIIGEKATKSTTKNLKQIVEEDENESREHEEDEKVQEAIQKQENNSSKSNPVRPEIQKLFTEERILKPEKSEESSSESYDFSNTDDGIGKNKIWEYMRNSSLFIFHKDWQFREFLLGIVTTPEDIIIANKAESNPEKYGLKDLEKSQTLKNIQINRGKILTTKERKLISRVFEYFVISTILLS